MKKMNLISAFLCFIALAICPAIVNAQTISTVAGCGIGDDSMATKAELAGPVGIAFDNAGNAYIGDAQHYRVRKVTPAGIITTFAGNGYPGYSGDGGPAIAAGISDIYSVAADRAGNVYFVDNGNNCIRKVNTSGIISTIAGNGTAGFAGDNGPATAALLNNPVDIIVDTSGNIIFTDWQNYRVRKINTSGIITTIVGDGATGTTGNHGPATASELGSPFRVTMDNKGNLYVAEVVFQCICKVDTAGILTIIADTTGTYSLGADGDGGSALTATMTSPCGLATDTSGNLFFSDIGNNRVRRINMNTGIISNYAATGVPGYSGDGGPATAAQVGTLEGLAFNGGNLYISDADNNRIRGVNTSGTIFTFAGQNGLFGEGYVATNAELGTPANLATDVSGNIYIADIQNNRVRKIDAVTGLITTVAGSGIAGYNYGFSGDGGPATTANISGPYGVAVDAAGNIYIADEYNSRIRKVNTSGIITTIAGNGTAGYTLDGIPATVAELNYPTGIAVDAVGDVYIADAQNSRIRMVDTLGIIHTVAGTHTYGFSGDGGPAISAKLYYPIDIAVDGIGELFIADYGNNCIRKVDTSGIISTITNTGAAGFSGDGDSSIYAEVNYPSGIKADNAGNVFFADAGNQRIRVINTGGIINTIAGNGTAGFSGDGGSAIAAMLNYPTGIAIDGTGNMYIADDYNFKIRKVGLNYLSVSKTQVAPGNLLVYPNPTQDKVTISLTSRLTGSEQLTLFNILGQQVYNAPLLLPAQTIDMSTLASGVYVLQVTNNTGEKKTVKVTKE